MREPRRRRWARTPEPCGGHVTELRVGKVDPSPALPRLSSGQVSRCDSETVNFLRDRPSLGEWKTGNRKPKMENRPFCISIAQFSVPGFLFPVFHSHLSTLSCGRGGASKYRRGLRASARAKVFGLSPSRPTTRSIAAKPGRGISQRSIPTQHSRWCRIEGIQERQRVYTSQSDIVVTPSSVA